MRGRKYSESSRIIPIADKRLQMHRADATPPLYYVGRANKIRERSIDEVEVHRTSQGGKKNTAGCARIPQCCA